MATPWYATREQLKRALDVKETARNNEAVDRAIESASRAIEGEFHRRFYPQVATRYFDWPNRQYARAWRLWLNQHELISASTVTVAGETVSSADYFLRPDDGPPFTHLEIDRSSTAALSVGDTNQRNIAITGTFGHSAVEAAAGALEAAVASTSTTTVDVTDSSTIGVGTILKCDSERMIVTGRAQLDTAQNIGGNLTASAANVTVPVTDGTAYAVDETILVDSERMLVVDIAGNNLTVKRAWDGTVLAAHTSGADIYAPRRLTVERGALGTTAATHDDATALVRHVVPGPIVSYAIALAINTLLQEAAGYARTVGSAENEHEAAGRGLRSARAEAWTAYARKSRIRGV